MRHSDATKPDRSKKGQFLPGHSGNSAGRLGGSRRKLAESFLCELYHHWIKNGPNAIDRVWKDKPDIYLRLVVSLLPAKFEVPEVDPLDGVNMEEIDAIIAYCRSELERTKQPGNDSAAILPQAPALIGVSTPSDRAGSSK